MISQTDKIKTHLAKGRDLSPLQALSRFRCFRLASRIQELRKSGMPIKTRMVTSGRSRYAVYSLNR